MPTISTAVTEYFKNFRILTDDQQSFIAESLLVWSSSGLLDLVCQANLNAAFGEVRYENGTILSIDPETGNAIIEESALDQEITMHHMHGPLTKIGSQIEDYVYVAVNASVPHEFGHQLLDFLSQNCRDSIENLYECRLAECDRIHPVPAESPLNWELLKPDQVEERVFQTSYSRANAEEYWAEAVGAFSFSQSREQLLKYDPELHAMLVKLIFEPAKMVASRWEATIEKIQIEKRSSSELTDDMLARI